MRRSDPFGDLTTRERELVALIKEGLSNREMAERLRISEATVRHHLSNIYAKLEIPNRQKLLLLALQTTERPGAIDERQ